MTKCFIVVYLIFVNVQGCDNPDSYDDIIPGSRNYIWTEDTLKSDDFFGITDMWGNSPNSIWVTATGSPTNCLWYYNGLEWEKSEKILNSSLNTVFGFDDEVWIGDSYGTIWKKEGDDWVKFQQFTVDGYDRVVISSIYGKSPNSLYAVGFADQYNGKDYIGIILKYNGESWHILDIPNLRVGFNYVITTNDGQFLITGTNTDIGFLDKIYVFDGVSKLQEIYSDYYWPGFLYAFKNNVYVAINARVYKYNDRKLELWKDFFNTGYYGTVLGRNEKDVFGAGYHGIMHYNGTDIKTIYHTQLGLTGLLIFEKDVFFVGYDPEGKGLNVIIRGRLK